MFWQARGFSSFTCEISRFAGRRAPVTTLSTSYLSVSGGRFGFDFDASPIVECWQLCGYATTQKQGQPHINTAAASLTTRWPSSNEEIVIQELMLAQTGWWNWLTETTGEQPGDLRWQWSGLPESWGVFVWIIAVMAITTSVFWLYRRETGTCPVWVRMFLAGVRLCVLLLLVALLLRPAIFFQQVSIVKPTIAFLRDSSLSLSRSDKYKSDDEVNKLAAASGLPVKDIQSGTTTRTDLVNGVLARDNHQLLNRVRERGSLQLSDFADGVKPVTLLPALEVGSKPGQKTESSSTAKPRDGDGLVNSIVSIPPLKGDGLGTDIWQALRETLDNSNRLSAIVLLSEGQHNGSEDPVEIARRAAELEIPIFTVGIGDPTPARNLSVVDVTVRSQAYPDEPFEIEALLQANLPAEDVARQGKLTLQLIQQKIDPKTNQPGDPQTIETKETDLPSKSGRIRVDFSHVLTEPGQYVYTLKSNEIENETDTDDNTKTSAIMNVIDEQVRVLLISGLPNWDYQQVQRLLQRDPTISLSCWLQSMDETRQQEGDLPITQLPRTLEELAQYNVIIMIDPNPEEFDEAWVEALKEFCRNKAGGVLFMAGPQFTAEFITMNRLSGIHDVLPVRFGDASSIAASQVLASANDQMGGMLLVNHNLDHPVMSFHADAAENLKRWNQMPGFNWNFPTLTAKPLSRVLIERGDQASTEGNQPMLVAGRFGAGSVLYFGFQGTWRWRRVGLQAQYFDRFWVQVIRFLVENRSLQGSRRGFVDCDQPEYELGDKVTLIARLLDEQFKQSTEPTAQALVIDEQGRRQKVVLQLVPQQPGQYEGSFTASRTGSFEVTLDIASESTGKLVETANMRVVPPSAESGAYWLNEKLLKELAVQSGGKYFRLQDIADLPDALPKLETRAEFNSPPQPIWDLNRLTRFLALALPVFLLGLEWAVRKWFKLL